LIQVTQEDDEEGEISLAEQPPNLSEALEMMRKLHIFASTEQLQLHSLISDLESQLTDIYLDSKAVKQSSIKDYFFWLLMFFLFVGVDSFSFVLVDFFFLLK
jgi:hypothetical protein